MFDAVIMVDWSGGNDRGAAPKKDAIWTCLATADGTEAPVYHRNRQVAEPAIVAMLEEQRAKGRRVLIGFDLCFAYPAGFAKALTGTEDPFAVWEWFAARVEDTPKANNRFALAGEINAMFPGTGPFWFNATKADIPDLPAKGSDRTGHGMAEKRETDGSGFSPWQLGGAGAVGGQVIMGLPTLHRLRQHFGTDLSVWPFESPETPIVMAETYFSLLPDQLDLTAHPIKDAAQVALYAGTFAGLDKARWAQVLDRPPSAEGWVLGYGAEGVLAPPPPLKNDCFAMPQGAYWTPVDDALAHLRDNLAPVTSTETLPVARAGGRILTQAAYAARSHPPAPNTAVDGYGFKGPAPEGLNSLTLTEGVAAPGRPFLGEVPAGHAVRVLTGASLPAGVDTIVLQEDVAVAGGAVRFHGRLKAGANARAAGEDMTAGQDILPAGRRLTPADVATLTAAGIASVSTFAQLRVGVLSTGDELTEPGPDATDHHIFDANRPMLLADVARWGFAPVDLGRARDTAKALSAKLDEGAASADVILTSGGASGGDADHVSALLKDTGSFALWRVAVKPGRPLVMGLWHGTPVIGLPGNPVAAQVCALIFAYPALNLMAGAGWTAPQAFTVPASFAKRKKAGRREFLRARITADGAAEVFASEGSGRVSGLSWATGLVELPDEACDVSPGDPVRFLPFSGFGL